MLPTALASSVCGAACSAVGLLATALVALGVGRSACGSGASTGEPASSAAGTTEPVAAPPSESAATSQGPVADAPKLGARAFAVVVYAEPRESAKRLGYLRAGAIVERSPEPAGKGGGCRGSWYGIAPAGYVCVGQDATIDLDDPLLRASAKRPDPTKPLPYHYGFVRSVLPLYLRLPTAKQQFDAEFQLADHLEWYKQNKAEVQTMTLGADDVPLGPDGMAAPGKRLGELGNRRNSTELSYGQMFSADGDDDPTPFWLREGDRLIPNISDYDMPQYAVFSDRARRHTGLAFVGSFVAGPDSLQRRFAITTDLRLAPTSKVKPDAASPWSGVALGRGLEMPFAFVKRRGAELVRLTGASAVRAADAEFRSAHPLTGRQQLVEGRQYVELADGRWLDTEQASLVVAPSKLPKLARAGEKWIEVDLSEQVLVAWEGTRPVLATLVSTGRPAIGDPKTTTATPRGSFRLISKHITATMDSDEGSGRRLNTEKELRPGDPGYVPTKGDGVYGVTKRRGEGLFKLRDVPYIQYFEKNYAIHGSYWHDVFGIPRSHGCINLSPVDARWLFFWTNPEIPTGWHGVNVDKGTAVIIHK